LKISFVKIKQNTVFTAQTGTILKEQEAIKNGVEKWRK